VLVGRRAKGSLGQLSGTSLRQNRTSAAAVALSISYGADVVRVHNVPACRTQSIADAVQAETGVEMLKD
jgi:dihydropteroate synthase